MLTLYHHGSSVCAAKVRIVLAEKSLPWDGVYVDILRGDQFDPAYVKLNPKAVVPTLVHDGKVIVESTVICEYLDEVLSRSAAEARRPRASRRDAIVDQGGRRVSASGLRRDHLRKLPPAHHQAFAAGKIRRVSRKHAAGFCDRRLARTQKGNRASGYGRTTDRSDFPAVRQLSPKDGRRAGGSALACRQQLLARRHRRDAVREPARHAGHVRNVDRQATAAYGLVRADKIAVKLQAGACSTCVRPISPATSRHSARKVGRTQNACWRPRYRRERGETACRTCRDRHRWRDAGSDAP